MYNVNIIIEKKARKQGQITFYLSSNNFLHVPLQGLVRLLQRKPSPTQWESGTAVQLFGLSS